MKTMEKTQEKIVPNRILSMGWDYARSRTLATGVELDVFTHIAKGKTTVEDIAKAASASERGMEMLLNALTGLGLLMKDQAEKYHLAPDSEAFLVVGRPAYLGSMIMHTAKLSGRWANLTRCVKTGKADESVNDKEGAEEFFPELVRALFSMNYAAARFAGAYLKRRKAAPSRILDVGAGSSVWGIGIAQEFPSAKVAALDFPEVLKAAKEYARNFGLADRYEYIEGNLRDVDFGKGRYDLVVLGHVCHSEGRANTEKLIKKSFHALKKGGLLLIADFLPNDEKTGSDIPLLFGLNMLVNTEEGNVFTPGEFKRWLSDAGFKRIDMIEDAPSVSPLILAEK